jgi:CheY-like chemotaxis protein
MPHSILLVEDYPDLRAAIAQMLARNDYVCECVDSDGAVEKLRANHYEAILIGPRLSISADPVLRYLTENQPAELEHVVVMTNPAADEELADARCHVLKKPFSREQLLAMVTASR